MDLWEKGTRSRKDKTTLICNYCLHKDLKYTEMTANVGNPLIREGMTDMIQLGMELCTTGLLLKMA